MVPLIDFMHLNMLEDAMFVACGAQIESAEIMLDTFEIAIWRLEAHAKEDMVRAYNPNLAEARMTAAREELNPIMKRAMQLEAATTSKRE